MDVDLRGYPPSFSMLWTRPRSPARVGSSRCPPTAEVVAPPSSVRSSATRSRSRACRAPASTPSHHSQCLGPVPSAWVVAAGVRPEPSLNAGGPAQGLGRACEPTLASPHDLLTVAQTIRRLGFRAGEAREWLETHRLVREVAGRKRVIWGDVLAVIRRASPIPGDPGGGRFEGPRRVEAVRRMTKTTAF